MLLLYFIYVHTYICGKIKSFLWLPQNEHVYYYLCQWSMGIGNLFILSRQVEFQYRSQVLKIII